MCSLLLLPQSKATDFLDYFDERDQVFYFIGVLEEHKGRNVAVYHKVKDSIDWIKKYLGGESVSIVQVCEAACIVTKSNMKIVNLYFMFVGCAVKHAMRHRGIT